MFFKGMYKILHNLLIFSLLGPGEAIIPKIIPSGFWSIYSSAIRVYGYSPAAWCASSKIINHVFFKEYLLFTRSFLKV